MKAQIALIALTFFGGNAMAKLPPLSDDAKAKAAEAAAKAAWGDKVAGYQLCQAQDRIAAAYLQKVQAAGKSLQPASTPPCTDPGPFSYVPPESKPIEAAGAHSPTPTAATPPSTMQPAASAAKP
ncbi:hypothetical protein [Ottowia sp. VDI28]|uniref:hypothetical protein n=1 Tax=Ottowia sp. VDI28 TaxID=3133968 RepID=UPI003C2D7C2E